MTLAARIRKYPVDMKAKAVASELDCCPSYVGVVRWRDRNRQQRKSSGQAAVKQSVTLLYGDPRAAAWLQHWKNEGRGDEAMRVERFRQPITVDADWPPETPGITTTAYGSVTVFHIPPYTPEWASHVAAHRASGKNGKYVASAMEMNPKGITPRARWGTLEPEGT